jgi:flagellar hook assembly protein FlgD
MKKTLSVLVVLMVVSSVVFARRLDNPGASSSATVVKIGSTFKLYYKGAEQADVKISILNGRNNVVFSETLKKVEGFVRPYNFSKLPEGEYTIQISDKFGRQIEKITYKQEKPEALAHLLKVDGSEAKYLLTVSSRGESDVTVRIYDNTNSVIYNKTEIVSSDFARIYNLEGIGGEFTFEVSDAKGTISIHR